MTRHGGLCRSLTPSLCSPHLKRKALPRVSSKAQFEFTRGKWNSARYIKGLLSSPCSSLTQPLTQPSSLTLIHWWYQTPFTSHRPQCRGPRYTMPLRPSCIQSPSCTTLTAISPSHSLSTTFLLPSSPTSSFPLCPFLMPRLLSCS